jgi:hypothetical protein
MGMFRQVRRRHRIRVSGPATITVESGRASVTVEADSQVKIEHDKPPPRKVKLTPPKRAV